MGLLWPWVMRMHDNCFTATACDPELSGPMGLVAETATPCLLTMSAAAVAQASGAEEGPQAPNLQWWHRRAQENVMVGRRNSQVSH